MRRPRGRTSPAVQRVVDALARGAVLRFTGPIFREKGYPLGEGPQYPAVAVLMAVRTQRAVVSHGTESPDGDRFWEIEVVRAPIRSQG